MESWREATKQVIMSSVIGHLVKKIAVADLKAHLAEALREVEAGGRIVVERRGKAVAVLVPPAEGQANAMGWWRELDGIVSDIDDFDEIMRDVVRSRRNARPRAVDLGE
jgi:prevent-host-death family protein